MPNNQIIESPARPQDWANRLEQIAQDRSFFTQSARRTIRIAFTRFRLDQIKDDSLYFRLSARCSTYRDIGILYLQIKGTFEARDSRVKSSYKIRLGVPTSLIEWLLEIGWNLLIICVGIVLLVSAPGLPIIERIPRYGFLPLVYGLYILRLAILYKSAASAIPEIITNSIWTSKSQGEEQ